MRKRIVIGIHIEFFSIREKDEVKKNESHKVKEKVWLSRQNRYAHYYMLAVTWSEIINLSETSK